VSGGKDTMHPPGKEAQWGPLDGEGFMWCFELGEVSVDEGGRIQ